MVEETLGRASKAFTWRFTCWIWRQYVVRLRVCFAGENLIHGLARMVRLLVVAGTTI